MTDNKDNIPPQVRDYMASIGKRGGEAMKGTEAAKIRSAKATAARLEKEAKLKAMEIIPVSPEWISAVQQYLRDVVIQPQTEKDRFNFLFSRAVEENDMRKLGKYFDDVKQYLKDRLSGKPNRK